MLAVLRQLSGDKKTSAAIAALGAVEFIAASEAQMIMRLLSGAHCHDRPKLGERVKIVEAGDCDNYCGQLGEVVGFADKDPSGNHCQHEHGVSVKLFDKRYERTDHFGTAYHDHQKTTTGWKAHHRSGQPDSGVELLDTDPATGKALWAVARAFGKLEERNAQAPALLTLLEAGRTPLQLRRALASLEPIPAEFADRILQLLGHGEAHIRGAALTAFYRLESTVREAHMAALLALASSHPASIPHVHSALSGRPTTGDRVLICDDGRTLPDGARRGNVGTVVQDDTSHLSPGCLGDRWSGTPYKIRIEADPKGGTHAHYGRSEIPEIQEVTVTLVVPVSVAGQLTKMLSHANAGERDVALVAFGRLEPSARDAQAADLLPVAEAELTGTQAASALAMLTAVPVELSGRIIVQQLKQARRGFTIHGKEPAPATETTKRARDAAVAAFRQLDAAEQEAQGAAVLRLLKHDDGGVRDAAVAAFCGLAQETIARLAGKEALSIVKSIRSGALKQTTTLSLEHVSDDLAGCLAIADAVRSEGRGNLQQLRVRELIPLSSLASLLFPAARWLTMYPCCSSQVLNVDGVESEGAREILEAWHAIRPSGPRWCTKGGECNENAAGGTFCDFEWGYPTADIFDIFNCSKCGKETKRVFSHTVDGPS